MHEWRGRGSVAHRHERRVGSKGVAVRPELVRQQRIDLCLEHVEGLQHQESPKQQRSEHHRVAVGRLRNVAEPDDHCRAYAALGWLLSEQEQDPLERAVDLARGGKHAGVAKEVPDHQYGFDRGEQLAPLFVIDRGGWSHERANTITPVLDVVLPTARHRLCSSGSSQGER